METRGDFIQSSPLSIIYMSQLELFQRDETQDSQALQLWLTGIVHLSMTPDHNMLLSPTKDVSVSNIKTKD